ncbi:MAG: class I SAM-dependent methyltransferase [Verrucomicrobia subdivision 3 bacterium]|nr:class I SAM-dependent methyltransferase [Limisphaerales bacterium]
MECGLAFTRPRPTANELGGYYPQAYHGSGARRFPWWVEKLQRALYRRRAAAVEKVLGRKGRVLDVGCGPGFLLREFRERGWEVQGTEFGEHSARHAREALGLPVTVGDLSNLQLPATHFDAVVMWHVLEHIVDVHATIAEVARILQPGGIFLCAVPNFGSLEARCTRDKWFHLDVPRHLNHFTIPALVRLLNNAGFQVEQTSFIALEYDCFSFTQTALNVLGLRPNLLYNLLRGANAKVVCHAAAWQSIASVLLAAPLGLLSVPATTLAALLRSGATMTLMCKKESRAG